MTKISTLFLLLNLVTRNSDIRFKTQRASVEVCRQATMRRCPRMRTWVWSQLMTFHFNQQGNRTTRETHVT